MANTYAWTINSLDVRPAQDSLSDVVYNIHWCYKATSDQLDENDVPYQASNIGVLGISEPDPENFTAFEDLTQSQVEGWLEANIDLEPMKSNLDQIIDEKIIPTTENKNVPW